MKNFTLGLNIVLVIAVAVLFYLHFSSPKDVSTAETARAVPAGPFKVAYFEMDSIQAHFDYYKEVSSQLEAKAQVNTRTLNDLKMVLTNKYQEFQRIASALSQAEQAKLQQDLMQMESAFKGKEKMLSDEMQTEYFEKLHDVKKKIEEYIKQYNQDKGYSYVFASNPDLIYYKDSVYDITSDVLNGLNALYKKKK
jgi:outer membrane protein